MGVRDSRLIPLPASPGLGFAVPKLLNCLCPPEPGMCARRVWVGHTVSASWGLIRGLQRARPPSLMGSLIVALEESSFVGTVHTWSRSEISDRKEGTCRLVLSLVPQFPLPWGFVAVGRDEPVRGWWKNGLLFQGSFAGR